MLVNAFNQQQADEAVRSLTHTLGALRRAEEDKRAEAKNVAAYLRAYVNPVICTLYGTINSATRGSNVGTPQCNYVLEAALDKLSRVYQLLGDYTGATRDYSYVSNPGNMINVTEDISSVSGGVRKFSEYVREQGRSTDTILSGLAGVDSADMDAFRGQYERMDMRIQFLADALEQYAAILDHAAYLYREGQVNAISRANKIPY